MCVGRGGGPRGYLLERLDHVGCVLLGELALGGAVDPPNRSLAHLHLTLGRTLFKVSEDFKRGGEPFAVLRRLERRLEVLGRGGAAVDAALGEGVDVTPLARISILILLHLLEQLLHTRSRSRRDDHEAHTRIRRQPLEQRLLRWGEELPRWGARLKERAADAHHHETPLRTLVRSAELAEIERLRVRREHLRKKRTHF